MIDFIFSHKFLLEDITQLMYRRRSYMRTTFNFSVIIALVLISFSVFYYLTIHPFSSTKERETKITSCLNKVEGNYKDTWDKYCKSEGLASGCNLPTSLADSADNNRKQLRDECYKRYPSE